MYLKPCPFCNKEVDFHWDNNLNSYLLKCKNCESKGLDISIFSKSKENIQNLWNYRERDIAFIKDPEEAIRVLKAATNLNGDYHNETSKIFEMVNPYEVDKVDYGYLIFKDATVLYCKDSHPDELARYCNIDITNPDFDVTDLCIRLGIIRISSHAKCLMIDMPEKYSKNQITEVCKIVTSEKYKNFCKFCVYFEKPVKKVEEFFKLNDIILFLDKLA